ncbi:MAG TPA: glycosyltransferase family 39 protein [Candidatus Limnocylindrales bacterium]|nr:glycosyltransferase family 39 protein [Candidatus Limnocylindrales bacterium]
MAESLATRTRTRTFAVPRVDVSPWAVAIAALTVLGLLLLSGGYGFHRDELYFIVAGRHPDWGYADQPPFTPLLSAAMTTLLGVTPTAVRIVPALAIGACVLLAALMARDMGGDRRAQSLAALVAACSGLLTAGHLDSTATYDLLVWSLVAWLVVRLLGGADPRWWLAVGVAAGLGLQNKQTVVLLGVGLVAGLLLDRRWAVFRSQWTWAAVGLAILLWAPNLAWQAVNDFPQLTMASRIAEEDERAMIIPTQIVLGGFLLFPVLLAGLWWLLRAPGGRPWRPIASAYLIVLVLLFATSGKGYYALGFLPVLFAAGAIPLARWLSRGRVIVRRVAFAIAAVVSLAFVAVLTLPVLPADVLANSPFPEIYGESAEQIGWPELVATVEEVATGLSPDEQADAVVLAGNYGEASALVLLGDDLPPVYSGHNAYGFWGPPPEDRDITILIGNWNTTRLNGALGVCSTAGFIENSVDIDNEERGQAIHVCRGRSVRWPDAWEDFRFLN